MHARHGAAVEIGEVQGVGRVAEEGVGYDHYVAGGHAVVGLAGVGVVLGVGYGGGGEGGGVEGCGFEGEGRGGEPEDGCYFWLWGGGGGGGGGRRHGGSVWVVSFGCEMGGEVGGW